MTATTPEDAENWRDLEDQLTAEQIANIERLAHEWDNSPAELDRTRLSMARSYAGDNVAQMMLSDVPAPAGAVTVQDWHDVDTPHAERFFDGRSWYIASDGDSDAFDVAIVGVQRADGAVQRDITLQWEPHSYSEGMMSGHQARHVARALIAAADELHGRNR